MKWLFLIFLVASCGSDSAKKSAPTSLCGNGELDPGESCDPSIAATEAGACPASCSAGGCEVATLTGTPLSCNARCVVEPVACADGDGCCPIGCDSASDAECTNTCGDGQVDSPETCDGDCISNCGDACGGLTLAGAATTCSARCVAGAPVGCNSGDGCCPVGCTADEDNDCDAAATCGDGVVDQGESCDGNCPTSCPSAGACSVARLSGSAATCDAQCLDFNVTSCVGGDGCCPSGCAPETDADCSMTCGNGSIEAGETCDGNCPTSCAAPNACTIATLVGAANTCSAACQQRAVTSCTSGDGCCPAGCAFATDSDCACTPKTCAEVGAQCGSVDNGCGQMIQCPMCTGGRTCSQNTCITSQPGNGTVGALCVGDSNCAQGLVCDTLVAGGYCTQVCDFMTSTCPAGSTCGLISMAVTFGCGRICTSAAECEGAQTCAMPALPFFPGMICTP
jgi:hypothetical protein